MFMSASLLTKSNPGEVVDDLESFFWVLVWVCTGYPSYNHRKESSHQHWDSCRPTNLGALKLGLLSRPAWITQEFTPTYSKSEPLIRCVHNFAAILSQPTTRQ
ncbi:hypothetical protein PGTUg99_016127 [Puccinia graminis f. sp. tritici]|uniref:Fungal-type protein kinase domain-containing protein n=1 Tax=Puccinia graminis f. sp. tritici TaxID=56615 RepID=A0A5B0SM75_PUCGR|nr:hypothetical protein PGTUg99_016127 [Puccinia graminis f. sp. tritici]